MTQPNQIQQSNLPGLALGDWENKAAQPAPPAAGDVWTADGRGNSSWASPAFVALTPSGDTTGATDYANFCAAVSLLAGGGEIVFVGNSSTPFYFNRGLVPPQQTVAGTLGGGPVCLSGRGMPVLCPVGAAITGISCYRTSSYGGGSGAGPPYLLPGGTVRDLVIDGTYATGASVGIACGDATGFHFDNLVIKNFSGPGAVGALFANSNSVGSAFFSEKNRFQILAVNNATAVEITNGTGSSSWEYSDWDLAIVAFSNQNGVVVNGASVTGPGALSIEGDFATGTSGNPANTAVLSLINGGALKDAELKMKVESASGGTTKPWSIWADSGNGSGIMRCYGAIINGQAGIVMNGSEFSFSGPISPADYISNADSYPSTALPASGTAWVNQGPDAIVTLVGGTLTGTVGTPVSINGVGSGLTAAQYASVPFAWFPVPAGASITVKYSAAPTFTVIPSGVQQEGP